MAKVRVAIYGVGQQRVATLETGATIGAQVGVNLLGPDGRLVTPAMWKAMQGGGSTGSGPDTTDALDEGAWNLYFTERRAQDAVGEVLKNSARVTLTYVGGESITADLTDVTVSAGGALKKYGFDAKGRLAKADDATTDDLAEGDGSLYFTPARAAVAAMAPLVVADGATFQVPADAQCLFCLPMDVEGALDVSGALVEVA